MSLGFISATGLAKPHPAPEVRTVAPPCLNLRPLVALHTACLFAHLSLAVAFAVVGDFDTSLDVYHSRFQSFANGTGWRLEPQAPAVEAKFHLVAALFVVHATSAFFHLGSAYLWRHWYAQHVLMCFMPTRWLEYAITAAIMIVVFGYFSGLVMLVPLVLVGVLAAVTQAFGYLMEMLGRPDYCHDCWEAPLSERLTPFVFGAIPLVAAFWAVLYAFVAADATTVSTDGNTMPRWVYAVVISELILYASFAGVAFSIAVRPPSRYYQGEMAYAILSLASKAVLGCVLLSQVAAQSIPS